ncbi:MAG: aminoglycoside phosphotransferase family protein [Salinisphaera sp.]|nr:aminoglycoside phosphotransferase family protein [Salinisphaera sp.]
MTFDQIKIAHAAEDRAKGPVTAADQIPMGYELTTTQWWSAVLCRDVPGAEVTRFRLDEPDEGTASRRRVFLEYNDAGRAAGLPTTVFCKATPTLASRCLLGMNGAIEGEVTFYNLIRPELEVEAPRSLFANFDPQTLNSIIVLEDMGGEVEFCDYDTPMDETRARDQMQLLARIHGGYYESPKLTSDLGHMISWPEFFTITAEEAGFGPQADIGFREARDVIPPSLFARASEIWPATEKSVALHRALPKTVVHSDVHLRNWYITGEGRMGLNDWQCMCIGHWGRDLAYCIATGLAIGDRRAWEADLIRHYLDEQQQAGAPATSFDDAWTYYRQNLFGALAWWTPVLSPNPDVPDMQPRDVSMEFIKRMTHAIDDTDALGSVG